MGFIPIRYSNGGIMTNRNQLRPNEKYLIAIVVIIFIMAFLTMSCTGPRGNSGAKGIPGYSPLVGTLPATSQECLNGGVEVYVETSKTVICNGAMGSTGHQGLPGLPGANATPITLFKFCPNAVGSYASSFPEYGIRVNNDIYAVYSANGGFLTLLLPGPYVTTGIGVNCNFTINTDGSLSY